MYSKASSKLNTIGGANETLSSEPEARMFANACEHLKKQFPHLSDEHIRCCVEITAVMIEGTIYRRLTPLKVPSEQLEPIYQNILNMLFSAK